MLNIDLAEITRGALLSAGCSEDILKDFDGHSTISLAFKDSLAIFVSTVDEDVWLWSRVCEMNENVIEHKASVLFPLLMETFPFCRTGQLQFSANEGFFELKAMVTENYLYSHDLMAEALADFYSQLLKVVEILR